MLTGRMPSLLLGAVTCARSVQVNVPNGGITRSAMHRNGKKCRFLHFLLNLKMKVCGRQGGVCNRVHSHSRLSRISYGEYWDIRDGFF